MQEKSGSIGRWPMRAFLVLIGLMFCSAAFAQTYPLRIHPNGRYLEDQTGAPFFLNADAAWSLIVQLNYSDVNFYLTDRKARGFNGVIVELIEHMFSTNAPANIYNVKPFTGSPFTTPNEAYFAYADSVLTLARQQGIVVLLFPIYLGSPADQGWYNEVSAASFADMRAWGTYVGNRYKNFPNIIWVMGGDTDPGAVRSKIDTMAVALKAADNIYPNRLITTHSQRGTEAMSSWPESWVTLNSIYTSFSNLLILANIAYDRTPATPFILTESDYEVMGGTSAQAVREQAYRTILAGGVGYCFGNCPIWGLGAPNLGCGTTDWKSALSWPGSVSMTYFASLFTSRNWYRLVPDRNGSVLTAGAMTDSLMATLAYTSDSTSIIGYLPTQRSVTINPAVLRGDSMTVRWYNPAAGTFFNTGTFSKISRSYLPPATGDWVLVIDAQSGSGCCSGTRGNVNSIGIIDSADLSSLVSYLTGGGYILPCQDAANVNGQGIVDAADLSALVSYLTGGGYTLPACQ